MGVDLRQTDAYADQRSQQESIFGVLNSALEVGHRRRSSGLEDLQKTQSIDDKGVTRAVVVSMPQHRGGASHVAGVSRYPEEGAVQCPEESALQFRKAWVLTSKERVTYE